VDPPGLAAGGALAVGELEGGAPVVHAVTTMMETAMSSTERTGVFMGSKTAARARRFRDVFDRP
jgi:hypothetical protein